MIKESGLLFRKRDYINNRVGINYSIIFCIEILFAGEIEMTLWMIATLCAFLVKGLCGFANTLVFSTILSFGINNIQISPVELLIGYPANLVMTWRERKNIRWKVCIPLATLVLLGNIPGIFLLKNTDAGAIKVLFGIVIVLIGCEMLLRDIQHKKAKQSKLMLTVIGLVSGVLCGLYGIGALLAAYIGRVTDNSQEFKANICMVFIVENTFRLFVYCGMGIINFAVFKQAFMLLPFMGLGLLIGIKSGKVLNESVIKKLVIIMLIISGVALVINNINLL